MKFFLSEKNLGTDASKKQTLAVIELLVRKGWDVEYGEKANQVTDPAEHAKAQELMDAFTEDFMRCIEQIEKRSGA